MDELDHSIVFKKKSGNLILYGSLKSNEEEVKRIGGCSFLNPPRRQQLRIFSLRHKHRVFHRDSNLY